MIPQLSGLAVLRDISKIFSGTTRGADSLVQYTQVARVEPIALIDADVMFNDLLPDTMQSLQSIFAGYYLQAFAISMNIGSIDVVKHLEKFNPNRGQLDAAAGAFGQIVGAESFGMESYGDMSHRLPIPGDPRNHERNFALEAKDLYDPRQLDKKDQPAGSATSSAGRDVGQQVIELSNLSVGKLFNVEVTDGEKKAMIPISIRLLANQITTDGLVHILSAGSKDVSFKERYYQWKSGEIEFFKDLVLCQDLIDEHKRNLVNDKEGFYDAILRRRTDNAVASILSRNPSVATASNIVVMSSDTQTKVELQVNGALKSFKVRQKIFENSYLMLMAVIDKGFERVTFYHRGIPTPTIVGLRDMKASNKNTGPNVMDILNAFRSGSAPAI